MLGRYEDSLRRQQQVLSSLILIDDKVSISI